MRRQLAAAKSGDVLPITVDGITDAAGNAVAPLKIDVPVNLEAYDEYSPEKLRETIAQLEYDMREAAREFKFERAAELRDKIKYLRERELEVA